MKPTQNRGPSQDSAEAGASDGLWVDDIFAELNEAPAEHTPATSPPAQADVFDRTTAVPPRFPSERTAPVALNGITQRPPKTASPAAPTVPPIVNGTGIKSIVHEAPTRPPEATRAAPPVPLPARNSFDGLSASRRPGARSLSVPRGGSGAHGSVSLEPRVLAWIDSRQVQAASAPPAAALRRLELESVRPAPPSPESMRGRLAVGDYTGCLLAAEQLLAANPSNAEAARHADECREVLTRMYLQRLGPVDHPLRTILRPDELQWLSLDHRAGFLLSLIDGVSTLEEILDICGMSRFEALRLLFDLTEQRVIASS